MSSISSIALSGIKQAQQSIVESADAITSSTDPCQIQPIIELKEAELALKVNAKVIKIDQEVTDSILDILA